MERLKQIRSEKKISQYKLAKDLGVAQNTVSQWEKGLRKPDFEMLEKISNYFGITIDWLVGRENVRTFQEKVLSSDFEHIMKLMNSPEISSDVKRNITTIFDRVFLLVINDLRSKEPDYINCINMILKNIFHIGKGYSFEVGEDGIVDTPESIRISDFYKSKEEINRNLDFIYLKESKTRDNFMNLLSGNSKSKEGD